MAQTNAEAERRRKEREKWLLLLLLLIEEVAADMERAVDKLAGGQMSGWEFGQYAYSALLPAHRRAAYIGRRLAGTTAQPGRSAGAPPLQADEDLGWHAAEGQRPYLRNFVHDLGTGQYRQDGELQVGLVLRRAQLYSMALAGTANEAWALNLATNMAVRWVDVKDEAECVDCRALALNGPYLVKDLPTYPGRGDTECLMNCRCQLVTESGDYSVDLRYLFDRAKDNLN